MEVSCGRLLIGRPLLSCIVIGMICTSQRTLGSSGTQALGHGTKGEARVVERLSHAGLCCATIAQESSSPTSARASSGGCERHMLAVHLDFSSANRV